MKKVLDTKQFLLIDLLQALDKKELDRLVRFVSSTYFNTDKQLLQLLESLKKHVIRKNEFTSIQQKKVYTDLFPTIKIKTDSLDNKQKKGLWVKMALLTKLVKRFLTVEALLTSPTHDTELLSQKLLEKKQFNLLNRQLVKSSKEELNQNTKSLNHYAHAFQLELSRMNYFHQSGMLLKEDNFDTLIYNLDMYYLLNKLKVQVTMQSLMNVMAQKSYNFEPMEAIHSLLVLPQYANNPLIILFITSIELLKNNKEPIYKELLNLLEIHETLIPKELLIGFYVVACNFCAFKIRTGDIQYKKETFELYKVMDTKNLLVENNFMEIVKLKNIITCSCHVGEFEWAIKIINKYYPFVKKDQQKGVYHFNLGLIEFYQSNFKEAISHFIRVEKVNLAYDVDCKMLLLKSHFQMDTQYDERTVQIFRSTERFIQGNKSMPFSHKRSYKNFIQTVINLYRIRHKVGKKSLQVVHENLKKMDFINDKKWLLEKIKEIKGAGNK